MFARNTSFRMKSLSMSDDFLRAFENELVPLLRKQHGFVGEILMANPGSLDRIGISMWQNKADAEAYNVNIYPQVLKILSRMIDGRPEIRTFESALLKLTSDTDAAKS
jgi:hypothetical protein